MSSSFEVIQTYTAIEKLIYRFVLLITLGLCNILGAEQDVHKKDKPSCHDMTQ
jgi:hypothetical protein